MICTDKIKKIHLTGICGTAMGNIAVGLKNSGYEITGSDSGVYPPMSDFLKENGIEIFEYSEENVKNKDLVIIGNAIPRGNVEVEFVLDNKIPFTSLPEAVNSFFVKNKKLIMVTGTHGKTTTTSLIAFILEYCGLNPSFLIGGIVPQLKSGFKYSEESKYFVLEGDEYDTAFFDKTSKFLKFTPDFLVINYLEFDHGDIFDSLKDIKKSFIHLLKKCPKNSTVFLNNDHKTTLSLKDYSFSKIKLFGFKKNSDFKVKYAGFKNGKSIYKIKTESNEYTLSSYLHGKHNARNLTAAFSVCYSLGLQPEKIIEAIESFYGVSRRFETYYENEKKGITVIQDFAHHPTAFEYTIKTAKKLYPNKKIIAIIEPATNTMRSGKFGKKLKNSVKQADLTIFLPVPSKKRHSVKDNFTPPEGENIVNLNNKKDFEEFLGKGNFENSVFLFMSNGAPWGYMKMVKKFYQGE
ncbi:UDP-N-acetylmuramate: L-alanyl-gamma-D-glutamyl-meso-diaminopimelate ligase [Thermotomaculum hydrothermale]|uniref:UDP-N-acetylmuramate: L-alanyl-gamma-D-glutamyl-meso-diaminopimelate ligase n=1 Tax=Thermotomaculum hydrothermale TaxID=981385 RepID=A0A7R6PQZ6_9BACT|nr:Mur ligase family protein [Thermotomaculum hydrothermale]BBB32741.1 UDP-N-acetylmuramate: L-alanyl-gamma-D-glutamyl-meso-diaminopimelate ligase [Thermotomaculum hydrothermale]